MRRWNGFGCSSTDTARSSCWAFLRQYISVSCLICSHLSARTSSSTKSSDMYGLKRKQVDAGSRSWRVVCTAENTYKTSRLNSSRVPFASCKYHIYNKVHIFPWNQTTEDQGFSKWMDKWLVFNGSFSTERLFSAIRSYNFLYKQISQGFTKWSLRPAIHV